MITIRGSFSQAVSFDICEYTGRMVVVIVAYIFTVESAVKFMLTVEDDEEWKLTEDIGEDEDSLR